tara:strand:+ start:1078 stop:2412 length:1335 start_codon:yes stop_codon:yes gene_type:complete
MDEDTREFLMNLYSSTIAGIDNTLTISKIMLLLVEYTAGDSNHDPNHMFDSDHINFSVNLVEPLKITKQSHVYMDIVLTYETRANTSHETSHFILEIKELFHKANVGSSNASEGNTRFDKILYPNMNTTTQNNVQNHRSKKYNYVCTLEPTTITKLSGSVTMADGTCIFNSDTTGPTSLTFTNGAYVLDDGTGTTYPHFRYIAGKKWGQDTGPRPDIGLKSAPEDAYDLGFVDITKPVSFHITGTGSQIDSEIFIFKTTTDATYPWDNTLLEWGEDEKKGGGSDARFVDFVDHNDNGDNTEAKVTYPANTLFADKYYWVVVAKYNTSINNSDDLDENTKITKLEDNHDQSTGAEMWFGAGGTWSSTPAVSLKYVANGNAEAVIWSETNPNAVKRRDMYDGNHDYVPNPSPQIDGGGRFYFRFQTFGGKGKLFATQLTIIPTEDI